MDGAKVIEVMGKSGTKGIYRVRARFVDEKGGEGGKVIVRNVMGPIRIGDIIVITEREMEAAGTLG